MQEAADGLPESAAQPEQSETEGVAAEPEEPEEPKDPPYTGPLYEISVGAVQDKLPDFCGISTELHGRGSKLFFFPFANSGDFVGYDKEWFGHDCYLTNSKLMSFPELDEYVFLCTVNGKTVFCNEEGAELFLTDGDGNILYTAPENLIFPRAYAEYEGNAYCREGLIPVHDTETGCDGYLNAEDYSVWMLDPEYAVWGYTVQGKSVPKGGVGGAFREGMKDVNYAETMDALFHIAGQNGEDLDGSWAENDIAGFVGPDGEFIFRFSELPQFEGSIICRASSYYQGTAIIACHARGMGTGVSIPSWEIFSGYETYYEIDTQGNILGERTEDDYFDWSQ